MAQAEFPELELLRGHEVMLDVPDPDLSDRRLRLAGTSYVLVEWPGLRVPPSTLSVLEKLVESGVRPIVAHPERYWGLDQGINLPGEWRARGALLQVNYGSLLGRYGGFPRRLAWRLLEAGWVDLMASDFHGRPNLSPSLAEAGEALAELGGGAQFDLLAGVNPVRVLRDEETLPVPPLAVKPRMFDRLRDMFQIRERW
jgi:protein-tyrosine phosphatase